MSLLVGSVHSMMSMNSPRSLSMRPMGATLPGGGWSRRQEQEAAEAAVCGAGGDDEPRGDEGDEEHRDGHDERGSRCAGRARWCR